MDNELTKKVRDLQTNIRELKTRQVVGGDSWVVYRTEVQMPTPINNAVWRVDFTPDTDGPFVAKAYSTSTDRVIYGSDRDLVPDPNYFGRWYAVAGVYTGWVIIIYSTKKGTATITRTT